MQRSDALSLPQRARNATRISPLAQRTAKGMLNGTEDATLSIAIELEGRCYGRLRSFDGFSEGVAALHEWRPAKFGVA